MARDDVLVKVENLLMYFPVLAELRQRDLLKGECEDCQYKLTCSRCRGRAYEETRDMMATDPACWIAPESATKARAIQKD